MTVAISTLGQMALRRLGVRIVPLDDSPTLTEMVPVAQIATEALIELGVLNSSDPNVASGTTSAGAIATAAFVELGVLNSTDAPAIGTASLSGIADAALVELGVLNSTSGLNALADIVSTTELATLAIKELLVLNSDYPPETDIVLNTTIATAALVELGVIASDEAPSATDEALMVDKVASVHGALVAKGIARWNIDEIPRGFTEEYTKLTAMMAASSFGKTADPALVDMLEGRIRAGVIVLTNDLVFMEALVTYAHDSLIAQGTASWPVNAIPRAFTEEYAKLTVAYASASFGKQGDPDLVKLLELRVHAGAAVIRNGTAFMEGHVGAVHDSLVAQGIADWALGSIPGAFSEEYTKLAAAFAAASFGKPVDPDVIKMLEMRVRLGATVLNNDEAFMLNHVNAVQQSLEAQGIAFWSVNAIPQAFFEDYTKLTALYAAASFGKQADASLVGALEDHIRKGATVLNNNQHFMLGKVASVHAALDAQGVVWWPGDAVPRAFAQEYTTLTVLAAGTSFGKPPDPKLTALLETRVRRGAITLSSDDIANQHVQAVHDDLAMRGLAHWSSFDIPDAVGDAYSWLAANRMAALFEAQVSAADVRAAEVAIYRYIALPTSGETVAVAYF